MKKALIFLALFSLALAEKIGDIANIVGVRSNDLIGYGIVIGLDGTGDNAGSKFTMQSVANMLESMNVKVNPDDVKSKNVAAVLVTASLPAFARQGDKLDIKISSIGDAKSIKGGTLILTPLSAVDGGIYALAQGNVTLDGGNNLSGVIVSGATVEKEVPVNLQNQNLTLSLKQTNFQNAVKVEKTLNSVFGKGIAKAIDARTIRVKRPDNLSSVEFLSLVQELNISYTTRERIIIDEKSGTIVSGVNIEVHPVALSTGNMSLKISPNFVDSEKSQKLDEDAYLDTNLNIVSSNSKPTTIAGVVRAMQKLGVAPKDIASIIMSLKQSGAISADVKMI